MERREANLARQEGHSWCILGPSSIRSERCRHSEQNRCKQVVAKVVSSIPRHTRHFKSSDRRLSIVSFGMSIIWSSPSSSTFLVGRSMSYRVKPGMRTSSFHLLIGFKLFIVFLCSVDWSIGINVELRTSCAAFIEAEPRKWCREVCPQDFLSNTCDCLTWPFWCAKRVKTDCFRIANSCGVWFLENFRLEKHLTITIWRSRSAQRDLWSV